jgi:hypothetical protein
MLQEHLYFPSKLYDLPEYQYPSSFGNFRSFTFSTFIISLFKFQIQAQRDFTIHE